MDLARKHHFATPVILVLSSVAIGAIAIKGYKWSLTTKPDEPLDPYEELLKSLQTCNESFVIIDDHIRRIQKRLKSLRVEVSEEDLTKILDEYAGLSVNQLDNLLA